MMPRTLALAAAALLAPGAITLAQIAPPPTEAPPETTIYKRPPAIVPRAAPTAPKPGQVELPKLPYESLVKKGSDGKVIRLTEPFTWLACRRNPTITKDDWKTLEPIFAARKAECENLAVKNLDLAEKVEGGEIERITGDAKHVIQTIRGVFAPLKPSGGDFCSKLGKEGSLTEVQSAFSLKIAGEYNAAVRNELRADMKPKEDPNAIASIDIVRQMFREQIDETMCSYRALLEEASTSLDRALAQASPGLATKIAQEQRAVAAATDATKRAELFRTLLAKLDLQERRELLAKVIETRPK